ncbi:MAG: hypothetical protein ACOCXW_01820 [Bacteroidota bacterium]
MKKLKLVAIIFCIASLENMTGQTVEGLAVRSFGLHFSEAVTCSGHGHAMNMAMSMHNNRREMLLGAIYEMEHQKFTGAEMQYRVFLGKKNQAIGQRIINPYLYYNFIYRSSGPNFIAEPENISGSAFPVNENAIISSLEHFAGFGFSLKIFGGLYLDAAAGGGIYMGSINKDLKQMEHLGVHNENGGYGFAGRIGISYKINMCCE